MMPTTSQTTTAAGDRAASSTATDIDGGSDGLATAALGLACVSLIGVAVLAVQNRSLSQKLRSLEVRQTESRTSGSAPGIDHLGLVSVRDRDADGQESRLPRPLQAVTTRAAAATPHLVNERDRGSVARAVANPAYSATLSGCDGPGGCTATADDGINIYAVPFEGKSTITHTPNQMYASATPMMAGGPGSGALHGRPQPLGGGGGGGDNDRRGYIDVSGSEVAVALGERLCDAGTS